MVQCFFCREYLGKARSYFDKEKKWRVCHHTCLRDDNAYYGDLYRKCCKEMKNKPLAYKFVNIAIRFDFPALEQEIKLDFEPVEVSRCKNFDPVSNKAVVCFE